MNNNIYEEKYKIISEETDKNGFIKIHAMLDCLHEVANQSLIPTKLDRESLLSRNILWVLSEQIVEIYDLPMCDNTVIIKTWVGDEFYNFIPRFYQVENDEKILVKASAVWTTIDKNSRTNISPSKNGIHINSVCTNNEISILDTPKKIEINSNYETTVSLENLDFNNHMNNAQYLKIIDAHNPIYRSNGKILPRKIIARYSKESFIGDTLIISEGILHSSRYYSIDSVRGNHSKVRIDYIE